MFLFLANAVLLRPPKPQAPFGIYFLPWLCKPTFIGEHCNYLAKDYKQLNSKYTQEIFLPSYANNF